MTNRLFSAWLLGFALLIGAGDALAQCQPPKAPPATIVRLTVAPPQIDHTRSRQDLRQFDINTVSPYGAQQQVHVNGLMRGAISLQTQTAIAWQHRGGEDNCFSFDHVDITLTLNPTIYIAREIPANTCIYREVLAHEYKHYYTDLQIARDFEYTLKAELNQFMAQVGVIGPFPAPLQSKPKDELMARLKNTVSALNDRMKFERIRRQALIDTREEYERVASTCPAERHLM